MSTKTHIDSIDERIKYLEKEIERFQEEIDILSDERYEIESKAEIDSQNKITQNILNSIKSVSSNNSIAKSLHSDTPTISIMTEFYESEKAFLVFNKIFSLRGKRVSLVVAKSTQGVKGLYSGLTMTDLKKRSGAYLYNWSLDNRDKEDRIYPLYKELLNIPETQLINGAHISFKTPCQIGGQTSRNQTGYGSKYEGDWCTEEGTLYGETTTFLIIGIIVSSDN